MVLLVLVGCSEEITAVVEAVVETEPSPPDKITWGKDGKEMVLIPAGVFEMGDSKKEPDGLMENAWPVHTVELDAYGYHRGNSRSIQAVFGGKWV